MQFVSVRLDLPGCSARQQVAEPGSYNSTELLDWWQLTGPLVIAAAAQAVLGHWRAASLRRLLLHLQASTLRRLWLHQREQQPLVL